MLKILYVKFLQQLYTHEHTLILWYFSTILHCLERIVVCVFVGFSSSITQYEHKIESGTANEKVLYSLGWSVDELSRLNNAGHNLTVEVQLSLEALLDTSCDLVAGNATSRLQSIRKSSTSSFKGVH